MPTLSTEKSQITMRTVYLYALVELVVLGALVAPLVLSLSLKVLEIAPATQKEGALGLVVGVGALAAIIFNPIFGHLSDRTTSRFGRRRPWIVGGVITGTVASFLVALAPNLLVLVVGWTLVQTCYNATLAAMYALLADQVPEQLRSKASGIFGAAGFLGIVPGMLIATFFKSNTVLLFGVMPVIALVVTSIVCVVLRDNPLDPAHAKKINIRGIFLSLVFNPRKYPLFAVAWLQRFIMQLGYLIAGGFGLFFLMTRMGLDVAHATPVITLTTLGAAAFNTVGAFVCGYWAGRKGNFGPFIMAASAVLVLSLVINAFTSSVPVFLFSTAIAGFGIGCYYAVDLALAIRVSPADEAGRYLGAFHTAKTLPQSLAPAIAPFLLLVGGPDPIVGGPKNYASLYLVGAILILISAALTIWLRPALRRPAVAIAAADAAAEDAVGEAAVVTLETKLNRASA